MHLHEHMHIDTIVGMVQVHTCICVHIPSMMDKCMLQYLYVTINCTH